MERKKKSLCLALGLLSMFVLWSVFIGTVDVKPIGPYEQSVGFATLNGYFSRLVGTNMLLYTVTDWLSIIPLAIAFCFALTGLVQLIKRKSIFMVDRNIIALGIFYAVVISVYVMFEIIVINYRPVLIDGYLEASYPSSTTMITVCVMSTAVMQLKLRIKNVPLRRFLTVVISVFTAFMVVGRLLSGVHWITDIIGGIILSAGLVALYYAFSDLN